MCNTTMNRRTFLGAAAAAAAWGGAVHAQLPPPPAPSAARTAGGFEFPRLSKAVQYGKLPKDLPEPERLKRAKDLGFDGIEVGPIANIEQARDLGAAAREAGVPVHSVCYGGWDFPLSSPEPGVAKRGRRDLMNAIEQAHAMTARTVLLVPGVVTADVGYLESWKNSQASIREVLGLASERQIVIAVENVWNKFLLSPLEFARYVDEFQNPWVQAYFDVANVVIHGYPEDWIRTLAHRIHKVHVKDFRREGYQWVNLYEGDVDWPAVRRTLHEVGYSGWITEELADGDSDYLQEVSRRMSLISEGAGLS